MYSLMSCSIKKDLGGLTTVDTVETAFTRLSAEPTTTESGQTSVKTSVALFFLWRRSLLVLHRLRRRVALLRITLGRTIALRRITALLGVITLVGIIRTRHFVEIRK